VTTLSVSVVSWRGPRPARRSPRGSGPGALPRRARPRGTGGTPSPTGSHGTRSLPGAPGTRPGPRAGGSTVRRTRDHGRGRAPPWQCTPPPLPHPLDFLPDPRPPPHQLTLVQNEPWRTRRNKAQDHPDTGNCRDRGICGHMTQKWSHQTRTPGTEWLPSAQAPRLAGRSVTIQ